LLAGRWAYTDLFSDLARFMGGMPVPLVLPVRLLLALYAGALVGGLTGGVWQPIWPPGWPLQACSARSLRHADSNPLAVPRVIGKPGKRPGFLG
jgi:hypothetical protein